MRRAVSRTLHVDDLMPYFLVPVEDERDSFLLHVSTLVDVIKINAVFLFGVREPVASPIDIVQLRLEGHLIHSMDLGEADLDGLSARDEQNESYDNTLRNVARKGTLIL